MNESGLRFGIAVCTRARPAMLQDCLMSLGHLRRPARSALGIVVVENDSRPLCDTLCQVMSEKTGLPVHYALEPAIGIPFARNRALELCVDHQFDWIALIDDDETADPEWLMKLYEACLAHGAEVANGPVRRVYEKPAPHWWKSQQLEKRATGTPILEAPTNNVLIAARIVRPEGLGLRFDNRLTYGSEDMDFFRRCHQAGVKMIWVADAWVEEKIPASRVATRRLLSRLLMASTSGTFNHVLRHGVLSASGKFLPKALRRFVVGGVSAVVGAAVWPFSHMRGEKILFYGIGRVMKGAGNVLGLFGYAHRYYSRTDGQ